MLTQRKQENKQDKGIASKKAKLKSNKLPPQTDQNKEEPLPTTRSGRARLPSITSGPLASTREFYDRRAVLEAATAPAPAPSTAAASMTGQCSSAAVDLAASSEVAVADKSAPNGRQG